MERRAEADARRQVAPAPRRWVPPSPPRGASRTQGRAAPSPGAIPRLHHHAAGGAPGQDALDLLLEALEPYHGDEVAQLPAVLPVRPRQLVPGRGALDSGGVLRV